MNKKAWRRRGLLFGPFSLLVAVMAAMWTAMPSLAATVVNEDIPVNGTVFNPCNGEVVFFQGTDHFTVHETLDNGGGYHLGIHDNIHVTATGDEGNTYVGNQEDNYTLNAKAGVESTSTFSFSEISKGSAPNFVVNAVFHITVNPDGTVTAFVDHFTAECHG